MGTIRGLPIAPSYTCMNPNVGGGEELRLLSQWVQLSAGAQINFEDQTPYVTYGYDVQVCEYKYSWGFCSKCVTVSFAWLLYISNWRRRAGSSGINLHNYSPFLPSKCLSERETQETNSCPKNYTASKKQRFSLTLFTNIVFSQLFCMYCILCRMNTALYRKFETNVPRNEAK
jgi:hypothetical protein